MDIVVRTENGKTVADWGQGPRRCAVGRSGIGVKHREGDGVTPLGTWPLRRIFYRPDRLSPLKTAMPVSALEPDQGWCETPDDPDYNSLIRLPHRASAETLWRDDPLYDAILVVGYNDSPVVPGAGSAIFVHVARPDYGPTEGCVALALPDLLEGFAQLKPGDRLTVRP